MNRTLCLAVLIAGHLLTGSVTHAQSNYRYAVDLTNAKDDQLIVDLVCPAVTAPEIIFYLPKIVPGTYMNSNYGKYVHDLKAYDKAGKELPVKHTGDNSWAIRNAKALYRISYKVEDTWDSNIDNMVYTMCGTSFEANKNFVINTCGLFGYFDGMKNMPYELNFTKPSGFYAATGLKATSSTATNDIFRCENTDRLYDSPIMFSLPDTATVRVGNTDVLIAIYSPHKLATARFIASHMEKFLLGARDYLGGKLPVDKYAFIFYFNGEQKKLSSSGAWEHSYSSFYSIAEGPQEKMIDSWIDIAAHEFFHIVTPLTISSKEVKEFNFNETILSKHLWLYEGSTEYYAHHMQVWAGLHTPEQFFTTLSDKIYYSRDYMNDSLSFTELSKESAGKWKAQYGNVYMKGALIGACLDLYLLKLSHGQYAFRDLKHDLGVKYGKDKYFLDDELFDEIGKLTYPEIKDFLVTYVQGGTPIPYEQFFAMAGVDYIPSETTREFSLGGIQIASGTDGKLRIGVKGLNAVGKQLGYQEGDELVSVNGEAVTSANIDDAIDRFQKTAKEGDKLTVIVRRKKGNSDDLITLTGIATKVEKATRHIVRMNSHPNAEQLLVRNAWLGVNRTGAVKAVPETPAADPTDVSSIDNIVKALYDVISGPKGARDWNRFNSLFHADAFMGAITPRKTFSRFSPAEYAKNNTPFFLQYDFAEREIGRTVNQFGSIAQVFTTYEYTLGTPTPENQRGINSLELVNEKGRWWIMSISWDEETNEMMIPQKYIGAVK